MTWGCIPGAFGVPSAKAAAAFFSFSVKRDVEKQIFQTRCRRTTSPTLTTSEGTPRKTVHSHVINPQSVRDTFLAFHDMHNVRVYIFNVCFSTGGPSPGAAHHLRTHGSPRPRPGAWSHVPTCAALVQGPGVPPSRRSGVATSDVRRRPRARDTAPPPSPPSALRHHLFRQPPPRLTASRSC